MTLECGRLSRQTQCENGRLRKIRDVVARNTCGARRTSAPRGTENGPVPGSESRNYTLNGVYVRGANPDPENR